MKNIVLIGFMATGKSSVGRCLARMLRREFVDTDREIERLTGRSVVQIFATEGEKRFRSEEKLLCAKLARRRDLVIATGGGTLLDPENVRQLGENGVFIQLTASVADIWARARRKGDRPLLHREGRARIVELLEARAGLYDVAEFTVDTGTRSVEATVREIIRFLKEKGYLDQTG
ncbi:shikimate kinase [Desulforudis sp. 1088]|uniref:shikimate kinase n=1 Tax=unclassified Candidatus Desulforudis TaxID=2635950 RepID=UPI00346B8DE1